MPSENYIIVGGGLAGVFSAKVLQSRGYSNIYIIEKSENIGGLLQHTTAVNPLGDGRDFNFDYGTHFVLEPDNEELRKLVREDLPESEYITYQGSLQEAHVLNGKLYEQSGCVNIAALSQGAQAQIKAELEELHKENSVANSNETFEDECIKRYGNVATETVYAPAYKKFTGVPLRDLALSMGSFFAPSRLIVADREQSISLKQNADWDWRIAYADCEDGTSNITKYYPKQGGIGRWLDKMAESLKKKGVKILTGTTIESVEVDGNDFKSVTLSNGEILECKQLIWSLPAIFLAMLTKTEVPSQRPLMRQVLAVNILTDKKPVDRPYWVTIYDDKVKSYRVTLYDNFVPTNSDVYRITVEILHGGEYEGGQAFEKEIFNELKSMNIIDGDAQRLWSDSKNKPEGFPVLSTSHLKTYLDQYNILEDKYRNLVIVGRRPDTGGGQLAVMDYIWRTLKG